MNLDSLDLNLPTDPPLPPPPPADREALYRWQAERLSEFYQSPHYEAWLKRTLELKRGAPFVWID